jgi:NAD(P)H-dependent FMN reductase
MPTLQIIVGSVRPGRVGLPVARWFEKRAKAHGHFDIDFADLAEIGLPFTDEPSHPRLQDYVHDHTKEWSARVERADAFAWVMPEYNTGMAPALKNALDFLNQEWRYKPVGMVSYGGVSAGTRSSQQAKLTAIELAMFALRTPVAIPFVKKFLGDDGEIEPNDEMNEGAEALLDELAKVEATTRQLREPVPA